MATTWCTPAGRRKETWWLRLSYYSFYRLITLLSDINLPLDAATSG